LPGSICDGGDFQQSLCPILFGDWDVAKLRGFPLVDGFFEQIAQTKAFFNREECFAINARRLLTCIELSHLSNCQKSSGCGLDD
jgi:hypothetical protein